MSQPIKDRESLRCPHSSPNSVYDWVGTRSNATAIPPEHRIKDCNARLLAERVEVLPVIASFLVATLLTLSILPQSKASMGLKKNSGARSQESEYILQHQLDGDLNSLTHPPVAQNSQANS